MTNAEMYDKFKLAGYAVEDGMTQTEMRAIKNEAEKPKKDGGLVVMLQGDKQFKVQAKDVDACLSSGMTRKL